MFRVRWFAVVALLGTALVSDPDHSPAQFAKKEGGTAGGGFARAASPNRGGGSGFKMDPEVAWNLMQHSTQSTGDTIDLSKMDPRVRDFAAHRAEQSGGIPLPTSGRMTKAQFLDHTARSEAGRACGPAGVTPEPVSSPQPGGPVLSPAPGGLLGPGRPGGFAGGNDDRTAQRFQDQDADGDGRLSFAEADGRLKENFARADRNGDGYVDLEEYRSHTAGGGVPGNSNAEGGNSNGGKFGGTSWGNADGKGGKKGTQERTPVAVRYGHLPRDLPEWFDTFDTDRDGQVALHEWRKAGAAIATFQEMDLNGDGLITADELLRFNLNQIEAAKLAGFRGEAGSFSRPPSTGDVRSPGAGGFSRPGSTPPDKGSGTDKTESDKARASPAGKVSDPPAPIRDGGFGKKGKN